MESATLSGNSTFAAKELQSSDTPLPPLFRSHPALQAHLPHVALGKFPTPVEKQNSLGTTLGMNELYVKRDDRTGEIYGGNKVRKLEFLLGDALRRHAREVVTFVYAGSNHALATAIYAHRLGLRSTSMLLPQVNAHYVRRNLLAGLYAGAKLLHYRSKTSLSCAVIGRVVRSRLRTGVPPVFIPAGGTCPLGIIGYVNAAFELKEQIRNGTCPEPDVIYVALGSMGTAAGLILGLKAAGLESRVVAVRVIEERVAPASRLLSLIDQTRQYLQTLDTSFPDVRFSRDDLIIRNDFLGEGYAWFTAASVRAAKLLQDQAGIEANGTYTAKAFAAVVHDARQRLLNDKTVLFWNTYNSRPFPDAVAAMDYHWLLPAFYRYFETDVQPLDRT